MARPFQSRRQAGRELATKLSAYAQRSDVLVLGLPRGGVPVAFEVARALRVSLDVFLVRKLGVPGDEELAMGAIASGGVQVLNDEVIRSTGISERSIAMAARREQEELVRRERLYRGDRPAPIVEGRIVILVDDGLATGSSMRAAALALRRMHPAKVIVAVPVGAAETCEEFKTEADEVVCAVTPERFTAVGAWYADFSQTTDDEVRQLLLQATEERQQRSTRSGKRERETQPGGAVMEIVIKLSPQAYRRLRSRIPRGSSAYEPVEKATPIEHSVEGVLFAGYSIVCGEEPARRMLEIAKRECPEAVGDIEKALSAPPAHSS